MEIFLKFIINYMDESIMTKVTNKLVNGEIVALTDAEITQQNAEETAFLDALPRNNLNICVKKEIDYL